MSEERTLESIVDPFLKRLGGERVSDIIGNTNPQASADYLFRRYGVIAELKSVQAGTFTESFRRKLTNLLNRWQREGKVIVYGTAQLNSNQLPSQCREEMFSAMAESLQKHIVAAANAQIRSTKQLLNMPDAKGLLWVASDGNEYLQAHVLSYLLKRILKKTVDGQPAYSSINGLSCFNPRMLTQMPGVPEPVILWSVAANRNLSFKHVSTKWRPSGRGMFHGLKGSIFVTVRARLPGLSHEVLFRKFSSLPFTGQDESARGPSRSLPGFGLRTTDQFL